MIEIVPKSEISIEGLKQLRNISSMSISEIKEASLNKSAIRIFEIFGDKWEDERLELVRAYKLAKSLNEAPYFFYDREFCEELSLENLKNKFSFWRSIELETQRNSDLENGYINTPEEFEPHDDEWA